MTPGHYAELQYTAIQILIVWQACQQGNHQPVGQLMSQEGMQQHL
jgi:hypothetical protein